MTGSDETITKWELAEILGKSERTIRRRAKKEGWPVNIINNRGDQRFIVSGLPEDVKLAVRMNQSKKIPPSIIYELRWQNQEALFVLPESETLQAEIQELDEQIEKIRDRKKWRMMCLNEIEEVKNEGAG